MDKRLCLIIKPAVKYLQTVHQSLWIASEVCFTITEFMVIDSRFQCLFVHSVFYDSLQCIFDHFYKFCFLLFIGILCHNGEDRLIGAAVIRPADIFSDSCFKKCFCNWCSWCRKQCIIQDLECQIQLFIQRSPNDLIVGKIGVIFCRFITCDRIRLCDIMHLLKRLLQMDLRIYFFSIVSRQIFLIQPI